MTNMTNPDKKPTFIPHNYQQKAIDFIIDHHSCACFLDCGLGKTPITLSVIKKLNSFPVLVVGPKLVIENVWRQEASKWADFSDLTFSAVVGDPYQRDKALRTRAQVYLISRDNLAWAKEHGVIFDRFKFIVLDESSSFKNPDAERTKALFNLPHPRKVLLSATPAPKNLQDLFSQFMILDGGMTLGKDITEFRQRYMVCTSRKHHLWAMRYGAEKVIYRDIAPITISMRADDHLDMPKLNVIPHIVDMTDKEFEVYSRMERKAVLKIMSSSGHIDSVIAKNAAVLTVKLSQLANGFLYEKDGSSSVKLHDHKIEQLIQLIEEAEVQGERLIVAYNFQQDRENILDICKERKLKVVDLTTTSGVKQYQDLDFDIAILHPRSAGMGLNLQKGSRSLIWFSLPWSYEDYYQTISRIYRQGQDKTCFIHFILTRNTVDSDIVRSLNAKKECDDKLKAATKARVIKILKNKEVA